MALQILADVLKELMARDPLVNGVRNWPDVCDPRSQNGGACFLWEGFENEYPGPWKFRVEVQNAQPPNDVFNGIWIVPFVSRGGPFDTGLYRLVLPGGQAIEINKFYAIPPDPANGSVLYEVGFDCSMCTPPRFDGYGVPLLYPPPGADLPDGTPAGDPLVWPTPVNVRPMAWDATL